MTAPTISRSLRYLFTFAILAAGVALALTLFIPTHWFAIHSGDPYLAGMGYGASLHNANCDILIDGDSSAEVGLDPTIFEQQTHLKTCNIAEPDGVRVLNGSAILDRYLAQNTPPRLILFLFNAPNLNPAAYPGEIGLFEGFTYRMRQPHALAYALRHPSLTANWLRTDLPLWARILSHHTPQLAPTREALQGRLALQGEPRRTCADLHMPAPPDTAWLTSLRQRYTNSNTSVLINVMPLADCDTRFNRIAQQLNATVDNRLITLPVSDFLLQGPHMTSTGTVQLSLLIAENASSALTKR